MRLLTSLAAAALVALTASAAPHSFPTANAAAPCAVDASYESPDGEEQAAIDGINATRASNGLTALSFSPTLNRAAKWKASDMAAGAPMAHDDSFRSWHQRLADCGVDTSSFVSENIAAGVESGNAAVEMWNNSPAHRANVLGGNVRSVGVSRARGGQWGWYWAANFGNESDS